MDKFNKIALINTSEKAWDILVAVPIPSTILTLAAPLSISFK